MLGYSKSATVAFIHFFLLFLGSVHAAPAPLGKETVTQVVRRADNLASSTTVQTTTILNTSAGQMIQLCTITLDPISGSNGEPLVRETKSCTIQMVNGGNNQAGASSTDSSFSTSTAGSDFSTSTSAASTATSTSDSAAATSTTSSDTVQATSSAPSSSSATDSAATATNTAAASTSAASASSGGGAISTDSVSLVPGSSLSTAATDSSAATATASGSVTATVSGSATATASGSATASASTATGNPAVVGGGFSSIAKSIVSTESLASGTVIGATAASATSAADTAESSAAKFQLPGTKLSVLPIGLGVFAGISVIALIVVGLVTYERTKYRRAFRQRKLAESGAAMGYGGMAQAAA